MAFDPAPVFDQMVSRSAALGHFRSINTHEPKNAPGNGLVAAIWVQTITPVPRASGLASTTMRFEFRQRIYQNMLAKPEDGIDPLVITATTAVLDAYSSGFTLGGVVRNVDLLGAHGVPLQAQAGYLQISSGMQRVMDIVVPLIINDVFDQSA